MCELLLETGSSLLLETGDVILLEQQIFVHCSGSSSSGGAIIG